MDEYILPDGTHVFGNEDGFYTLVEMSIEEIAQKIKVLKGMHGPDVVLREIEAELDAKREKEGKIGK